MICAIYDQMMIDRSLENCKCKEGLLKCGVKVGA